MTPEDFNILLASRNVLKVKAERRESRLAGLRLAVLILRRYGITEEQIVTMSRPELDGCLPPLTG
ncbi:hypothetical protein O5699_01130 [Escherichia coli]|nr:hypothetical protein [Escherichia coli]